MPFAALAGAAADAAAGVGAAVGIDAATGLAIGADTVIGADVTGALAADAAVGAGAAGAGIGGLADIGAGVVDSAATGLADASAGITGIGGLGGDLSTVPLSAGSASFDSATAAAGGLGSAATAAPASAALAPTAAISGVDTGVSAALGGTGFGGAGLGGAGLDLSGIGGSAGFGGDIGAATGDISGALSGATGTDLGGLQSIGNLANAAGSGGAFDPFANIPATQAGDVIGDFPPDVGGISSQLPPTVDAQTAFDAIPTSTGADVPGVDTVTGFNPSTFNPNFANVDPATTAQFQSAAINNQVQDWVAQNAVPTDPQSLTFTPTNPVQTVPITPQTVPDAPIVNADTNLPVTPTTPTAPPASPTAPPANITPDVGQSAASAGSGAPTGIPSGGTPGLASQFAGVLNSPFTRAAELGLPLAALAAIGLRGPQKVPGQTQTAVNNAQDLAALSSQQAAIGQSGQLSPSQLAQITIATNAQKNQLYQLYASMGRDPTADSDYIQGIQQIDNNAIAQYQQFIQAAITNAISAGGTADNALIAAGNQQIQLDTNFENALLSATQSFALLAGLSNINNRMTA